MAYDASGAVTSWADQTFERDRYRPPGRPGAGGSPTETQHASLDHLGTPRLWTGPGGVVRKRPEHLPYGEPAISSDQKFQFTGHERDERGAGTTDDLDYMHARYYSPHLGRFLSVDPATTVRLKQPQFWNRYAYVINSPLGHVDPDGEALETVLDVVGVGYDIVELVREPSLKNAGILVLDIGLTAVPFVPNIGGTKLAVNAARRGLEGASELARFSELARNAKVTDDFLTNKVLRLHGPSALNATRNKFISGFDVKAGIQETLRNPSTLIRQNTHGRAGAILVLDYGRTIGRNKKGKDLTKLKVVLDGDGNLVTAFPVR